MALPAESVEDQLKMARLIGIQDIICPYCEKLRWLCDQCLLEISSDAAENVGVLSGMLLVYGTVHDELMELLAKEANGKLGEPLKPRVSIKMAFGRTLDKKMKNLVAFEDSLTADDTVKGLELVLEDLRLISEIRTWATKYTKSHDNDIKTAAIETVTLLDSKEEFCRLLERGFELNNQLPRKEALAAVEKLRCQSNKYHKAMKILFKSSDVEVLSES